MRIHDISLGGRCEIKKVIRSSAFHAENVSDGKRTLFRTDT